MTTLRFRVQHDERDAVALTLEEQLPDAVDRDTVAVGPSDGKWAVYDNGTAQWSVSVRPEAVATAAIGVVCTDPDAVDALADDSSSHVILGGAPAPPGPEGQAVDTVEPASLESATARERVPESVYERVREIEDREGTSVASLETLDVDPTATEPAGSNAPEQFREVDDATRRAEYEEFEDEVDDVDAGAFDFGDEPVSFADLVEDPEGAYEAVADAETEDDGTRDDGQATERATDGHGTADVERVTERLLAELEQGGVTDGERVELRRRLGVDPQTSTEARLDHLHARVDELDAYTGALEAFLDEEGTARTLLADLTEDVAGLASRTDDLDDRVETNATTAAAERGSLDDRLAELAADRDADRERVDDVADTVDRNADHVERLADDVARNTEDVERLAEDVDERLETLQESIESLETIASTFDERLADVEDALAALEETVEENSRIREGLKSITT